LDDCALLQYIRHVAPHIPVIVLSASDSVEAYIKALSLGAFEYLQKPVGDPLLRQVVMKAMGAPGRTTIGRGMADDADCIRKAVSS
jgi:DNA-binding NtrC family response regulator